MSLQYGDVYHALQESSVSQNSKNSAITAHSTDEEEANKRFDF